MFPLGHLGVTLAFARLGQRLSTGLHVDYRFLLLGSLLPDLIDKPLSLATGIGGRSLAHTLLFSLALTLLFVLMRSRPEPPERHATWAAVLLGLAIGSWSHLLLDRMWTQPEILFWPFLGVAFPVDPFDPFNFLEGYRDPHVLIGDILGALALGYLAWRHRIYQRANFMRFLREGRLAPLTLARRR